MQQSRKVMIMFTGTPSAESSEAGRNKKLEEWTNKSVLILKSMQDALSILYDGLETVSGEDSSTTRLDKEQNLDIQDEDTVSKIAQTFIQNCQKLFWMISEPTHGPVKLPLGSLLKVISRCLSVSFYDVRSVPSMTELAGLLPSFHRAALEILSQLVLSCKTSLLPQSRTIIDLCLQALTSARHMDLIDKSQTKACIYQALCLIIQVFGWGRYLTQQSKSIVQELIADIRWQDSAKQVPAPVTGQTKQETVQGSKKKGKRKYKSESYNDLAKTQAVAEEKGTDDDVSPGFEATVASLELSQLLLGKAEFLSVESLVRCILDITQMIQREEPPTKSPFVKTLCRKVLYSAVFACSTVKLDPACCRKDSISHFQMTNLALSLLKDAVHKDHSSEVQSVCKNSLNILLVTENLNKPIVRRIQIDENNGTKDVTELEKEVDNAREENESLQKRLIDSELESQSQNRLIASLRQEIAALKEETTKKPISCAEQKIYLADPTDYRNGADIDDDLNGNTFGKEESDNEMNEEAESVNKSKSVAEDEDVDNETSRVTDERTVATNRQGDDEVKESLSIDVLDGGGKSNKRKCPIEPNSENLSKKKKPENGSDTVNSNTETDCIQDMISDFVDASPDIE